MSIVPFPRPRRDARGTIHVMGDSVAGFLVSHESSSGNSWGELHGPFERGHEAITAAYLLNRDQYEGRCNVSVCDAALQDHCPGVSIAQQLVGHQAFCTGSNPRRALVATDRIGHDALSVNYY